MHQIHFEKTRVTTFNDAIFSIAITLLVLQINIPNSEELTKYGIWIVLKDLLPSFIGYFVSFMVIAIYWISHMKFSFYLERYDQKLLWLNIFLLFFTVLLPFSTAFYVKNFTLNGPFVVYCANIIFLGLFNFLMIYKITKASADKMTRNTALWLKFRSLNAVLIWTLSLIISFFYPFLSRYFFIMIFIFQAIGDRFYKKREDMA